LSNKTGFTLISVVFEDRKKQEYQVLKSKKYDLAFANSNKEFSPKLSLVSAADWYVGGNTNSQVG
jgi:hypothetical protein